MQEMRPLAARLSMALVAACAWGPPLDARAQQDDAAALELADKAPDAPQEKKAYRIYLEGARASHRLVGRASHEDAWRASLDLRIDTTLQPGLRAVLSDRLDLVHHQAAPNERNVNTLREAYLSWQAQPDVVVDLGRVNVRHGVAWGWNPTDFFRAGALRSIVSPDPAALRENRQGTVVVRGQKVWSDSSLSAAYSPRLDRTPSDADFSLDLGSTNAHHRWLVAGSHKFGAGFNPELLLHGGEGKRTKLGLNLSTLLGDATVAYFEFAAGKDRSLVAQALDRAEPDKWRQHAAAGLTYTTPFNLSITAEADFNSAGVNRSEWDALRTASPADALRLLTTAQDRQDLPVRRGAFLYARWPDAFVRRLDLSGFVRFDTVTHSRVQWLETRYRFDRMDVALMWQVYSGAPDTVFGSVPQRRSVELSLRFYL